MILFTLLIDVMIKWKKWILELLPTGKRTLMMYALCIVLTSPIVKLYGEFTNWRTKMRAKSGVTPQVCMLRRIIKDEMGIDVLIEEGNGKPTDFIIKTSFVNVDMERQLFALLDRYKLGGKSYGYENAEILYDSRWAAYLCEKIKHNMIDITYYRYKNPDDGGIYKISIRSELPVASDLKISITFVYAFEEAGEVTVNFDLKAGENYYEIETWDFSGHKNESVVPGGDEFFDYIIITEDVYE